MPGADPGEIILRQPGSNQVLDLTMKNMIGVTAMGLPDQHASVSRDYSYQKQQSSDRTRSDYSHEKQHKSVSTITDSTPQRHQESVNRITDSRHQKHQESVSKIRDYSHEKQHKSVSTITHFSQQKHKESASTIKDSRHQKHHKSVGKTADCTIIAPRYLSKSGKINRDADLSYQEKHTKLNTVGINSRQGEAHGNHIISHGKLEITHTDTGRDEHVITVLSDTDSKHENPRIRQILKAGADYPEHPNQQGSDQLEKHAEEVLLNNPGQVRDVLTSQTALSYTDPRPSVDSMMGQRRRRWPSIESTRGRSVFSREMAAGTKSHQSALNLVTVNHTAHTSGRKRPSSKVSTGGISTSRKVVAGGELARKKAPGRKISQSARVFTGDTSRRGEGPIVKKSTDETLFYTGVTSLKSKISTHNASADGRVSGKTASVSKSAMAGRVSQSSEKAMTSKIQSSNNVVTGKTGASKNAAKGTISARKTESIAGVVSVSHLPGVRTGPALSADGSTLSKTRNNVSGVGGGANAGPPADLRLRRWPAGGPTLADSRQETRTTGSDSGELSVTTSPLEYGRVWTHDTGSVHDTAAGAGGMATIKRNVAKGRTKSRKRKRVMAIKNRAVAGGSKDIANQNRAIATDNRTVAVESRAIATDSKIIATASRRAARKRTTITGGSREIATQNRAIATDNGAVAVESRAIATDSKTIARAARKRRTIATKSKPIVGGNRRIARKKISGKYPVINYTHSVAPYHPTPIPRNKREIVAQLEHTTMLNNGYEKIGPTTEKSLISGQIINPTQYTHSINTQQHNPDSDGNSEVDTSTAYTQHMNRGSARTPTTELSDQTVSIATQQQSPSSGQRVKAIHSYKAVIGSKATPPTKYSQSALRQSGAVLEVTGTTTSHADRYTTGSYGTILHRLVNSSLLDSVTSARSGRVNNQHAETGKYHLKHTDQTTYHGLKHTDEKTDNVLLTTETTEHDYKHSHIEDDGYKSSKETGKFENKQVNFPDSVDMFTQTVEPVAERESSAQRMQRNRSRQIDTPSATPAATGAARTEGYASTGTTGARVEATASASSASHTAGSPEEARGNQGVQRASDKTRSTARSVGSAPTMDTIIGSRLPDQSGGQGQAINVVVQQGLGRRGTVNMGATSKAAGPVPTTGAAEGHAANTGRGGDALQSQEAVTAYLKSKQLLPLGFARQGHNSSISISSSQWVTASSSRSRTAEDSGLLTTEDVVASVEEGPVTSSVQQTTPADRSLLTHPPAPKVRTTEDNVRQADASSVTKSDIADARHTTTEASVNGMPRSGDNVTTGVHVEVNQTDTQIQFDKTTGVTLPHAGQSSNKVSHSRTNLQASSITGVTSSHIVEKVAAGMMKTVTNNTDTVMDNTGDNVDKTMFTGEPDLFTSLVEGAVADHQDDHTTTTTTTTRPTTTLQRLHSFMVSIQLPTRATVAVVGSSKLPHTTGGDVSTLRTWFTTREPQVGPTNQSTEQLTEAQTTQDYVDTSASTVSDHHTTHTTIHSEQSTEIDDHMSEIDDHTSVMDDSISGTVMVVHTSVRQTDSTASQEWSSSDLAEVTIDEEYTSDDGTSVTGYIDRVSGENLSVTGAAGHTTQPGVSDPPALPSSTRTSPALTTTQAPAPVSTASTTHVSSSVPPLSTHRAATEPPAIPQTTSRKPTRKNTRRKNRRRSTPQPTTSPGTSRGYSSFTLLINTQHSPVPGVGVTPQLAPGSGPHTYSSLTTPYPSLSVGGFGLRNSTVAASPSEGLSTAAVTGIAAGCIVAFWILLGPLVCFVYRMRDKASQGRTCKDEQEDELSHRLVEEMIRMELARGREKMYRTALHDEREIERLPVSNGTQDYPQTNNHEYANTKNTNKNKYTRANNKDYSHVNNHDYSHVNNHMDYSATMENEKHSSPTDLEAERIIRIKRKIARNEYVPTPLVALKGLPLHEDDSPL